MPSSSEPNMAPLLQYSSYRNKVLFSYVLVVFLFTNCIPSFANTSRAHSLTDKEFQRRTNRRILLSDIDLENDYLLPAPKKKMTLVHKNQTKPIKLTANSAKNQTKSTKIAKNDSAMDKTKLIKSSLVSVKNQTKLSKSASDSSKNVTKLIKPIKETLTPIKTQLKKLNSTSKVSNSTKLVSNLTKKPSDLTKLSSPKSNKTTKITSTQAQAQLEKPKSKSPDKVQPKSPKAQKPPSPNWLYQEDEEDDLVSDFRDLPTKFQQTLLPDLEKISTTSRVYLNRANKQITKGFKPYVGTKYAPTIASFVSFAFIIIPLILVSLIFNKIKAYFSIQKLLIFIQIYLSIYFSILCLSSLVTGLEPLRFFYATSQSTYICLQVLQTLGYVLYLLLLLMYLVLVFSTETGPGSKMLGLAQTFVGFAIGLHYYVTVFHRAVLRQPPRTNWKVHAIYAACFLVICLLASADRRKKAYLEEGGEEGKKS